MNVDGKITIFVKKIKMENEEITICNGTISTKLADSEERINKSVEVRFDRKKFPKEKLNSLSEDKCYQLEIGEGFLGAKEITRADGSMYRDVYIMVLDGTLTGSKAIEKKPVEEKKSSDLPF